MSIPLIKMQVEEVAYIINYITEKIPEYKLSEFTNNAMGDIPSIQNSHPLAVEYGNMLTATQANEENYTSILPAIGVELINDNEGGVQLLGSGRKPIEITQTEITALGAIPLKDRFKSGKIIAPANVMALQTAKTAKGSEKLWANQSTYFQDQEVAISVWSDNFQLTRILYIVMRDILKRLKHDISTAGVKNCRVMGQGALYDFNFSSTLYGAEFTLIMTNFHYTTIVDENILTIKTVNESVLGEEGLNKPDFKPLGG